MVRGTPVFDGLSIGSLMADMLGGTAKQYVEAKIAFVNSETGQTHGWTTHKTNSPAIMVKLRELAALVEEEAAAAHFADRLTSTAPALASPPGGIGGLGEHLGGKGEAPQV